MKKFISVTTWRDLTDGHLYHEGESFPFDGRVITGDRMDALETGRNGAAMRLILAVEVQDEQPEGQTVNAPEGAKKPRKTASRKKPTK